MTVFVQTAWSACLAAFSTNLHSCDDHSVDIFTACLHGIRCAIHVAGLFRLDMERDAYIQA